MHGHHHTLAPSPAGSVVLDIGGDIGALVLYVTEADLGREIEVSPAGSDGPRTHAAVRARDLEDGPVYCIVYGGLAAGGYTVWADDTTPAGTVTVIGGQVVEVEWASLG